VLGIVPFGGADGIRTHDLLDAIEARSQLRHGPTGSSSDVSIRAPASSMRGRQSVVVCALNIASEFSKSIKNVNWRKIHALSVGHPTNTVCTCEYGEDLIEKNNHFLSPVA
jgi:hypothetical protein